MGSWTMRGKGGQGEEESLMTKIGVWVEYLKVVTAVER